MKVNMRIPLGLAIVLMASTVPSSSALLPGPLPLPLPECTNLYDDDGDGDKDWVFQAIGTGDSDCSSPWDNREAYSTCKGQHESPHSHTYGFGGSTGARSDSATAGRTIGVTTVSDNNVADCDGDGAPGDFDGDYETGVGGGFFGYGPWANEPICKYGLATHGGTITVNDVVFGHDVQFVIGADDTSGPVITPVTDPTTGEPTGEFICETDGAITPGDPAQDPTRDADDCLTPVIDGGDTNGQGTTCGAGGDGGYWVFVIGARVHESGTGVTVNNPATAGTITA